jgi:hypothetical protein
VLCLTRHRAAPISSEERWSDALRIAYFSYHEALFDSPKFLSWLVHDVVRALGTAEPGLISVVFNFLDDVCRCGDLSAALAAFAVEGLESVRSLAQSSLSLSRVWC